jgi:hypothetical protein
VVSRQPLFAGLLTCVMAVAAAAAPALARAPSRAPALPPLLGPVVGVPAPVTGAPELPAAAQPEADPLVGNGLGSPSCRAPEREELSPRALRDCRLSGFVAAPAPTGDYGIDVHIDTGVGGLGTEMVLGVIQEAFVLPAWTALVWAVHALVVAIEWGFSLELLGGAAEARVAQDLASEQARITWPWLPAALALAGVLVAYRGLVRRRVADTLGETLVMGAMMVGGLWLISDPGGTVGALNRWSAETSTGALAAATGASGASARSLGDRLGSVFAQAVEAPWCYLEFGDVRWCEDPSRLDSRLRAAGTAVAAEATVQVSCARPNPACAGRRGAAADALRASVEMLREARTNGSVFLAFPANGPQRNSITNSSSLLHVLCDSSDANHCRGPAAAQAQFRTASGTESRLAGLALIAAGLLGMLLLLGYVAARLITSASRSFVYLLMAPALILSPAFGARGRALFRAWTARLFGAIVAKLVFAFVLGVLLSVSAIIPRVPGLGWWAQWMMLACFWWTTFVHRRSLLALPVSHAATRGGAFMRPLAYGVSSTATGFAMRRLIARRDELRASIRARAQLGRTNPPVPDAAPDGGPVAEDVRQLLDADARMASGAERRASTSGELEAQLERVERARLEALIDDDRRRTIELDVRRSRVRAELDERRWVARRGVVAAERSRNDGAAHERDRFLDFQSALPELRKRPRAPFERNYAALAPLAGYDTSDYEQLAVGAKRLARLEIDRRLRGRRAKVMDAWPSIDEHARSAAKRDRPRPISELRPRLPPGTIVPLDERASRDPVMRDLWAVAAGKKRRLGIGRD